MARTPAAERLAVLSKQLGAVGLEPESSLQRLATKASEDVRPAPGGGKGTLTVVDNRTGKKYTVITHSLHIC